MKADNAFRQSIFITILFLCPILINAQEIIKYQNSFSEKYYQKYLTEESRIIAETIDTNKIRGYLKLSWDILRYSDSLSLYYGQRALQLSEKVNSDSLRIQSGMRLGLAHINIGNFELAEKHMKKNVNYWSETKDSANLAKAHIHYGYLQRVQGNPYKGIEQLYAARSIQLNLMPVEELLDVTNRLIIAYRVIENHNKAIEIGEEFLDAYFKANGKKRRVRSIMANLHSSLIALEKFERADELSSIFIPLYLNSKTPKTRNYGYAFAHSKALRKGEYQSALAYADSSLMMSKRTKIAEHIGDAYLYQFAALKKLRRNDEALAALKKLRPLYIASNRKKNILDMAEAYSLEMAERGSYKKAYSDLYLADSLRKEIFKEDIADRVGKLEKKIIQEENEKQVSLLNERNQAVEENLRQEKKLRHLLLAVLGIALLTALLLWNFYSQRKKLNQLLIDKNKKLEETLEENKFLVKEVHHRVKNNMQVVASLLNLQSRTISNDKAKEAIIASKSRIISMSLLHKNIYGDENLKSVNLQVYFSDLLDSLDNTYFVKGKDITIDSKVDLLNVELDMAVQLGLITTEIVSNAFKHAFTDKDSGIISVRLKQQNKMLDLVIKDNGIGISKEATKNNSKSLGMRLIKSFAKKLKANLDINNENGTTYTIIIPLNN